jgi:hypothetical protein
VLDKHFHHHDVGDLELAHESVDMISDPGLTLTLYAAEPDSPTAHALCRRPELQHTRQQGLTWREVGEDGLTDLLDAIIRR